MNRILYAIIVFAIAFLYWLGLVCSNLSGLGQAVSGNPSKGTSVSFISSNHLKHSVITGERINTGLNLTVHSFQVSNCFHSFSGNKMLAFFDTAICLNCTSPEMCITGNLKTTDIIFPFHYFW